MPTPNSNSPRPKAWYRQFWPWFLISIPFASVILGSIMLYVAIVGRDTIVVDNYYKEGRAINQELSKDQFAEEIGVGAEVTINEDGLVRVKLTAERNIVPDHLVLKFFHPTLAGKDQQIILKPEGNLEYSGKLEGNLKGRWYLDILDDLDLWRLKGQTWLPREDAMKLGALSP